MVVHPYQTTTEDTQTRFEQHSSEVRLWLTSRGAWPAAPMTGMAPQADIRLDLTCIAMCRFGSASTEKRKMQDDHAIPKTPWNSFFQSRTTGS
jgi:hypothetical protein